MKILLVDDNKELRTVFRMILRDYDIDEADNGRIALDYIKEHSCDLILMDILMPEMNGITATKEILKIQPNITIFAITAYFSRANEILEAGAKEVLKKPIRKNELLQKIETYSQ